MPTEVKKIVVYDHLRQIQGHLSDVRKALEGGNLLAAYSSAEKAQDASFELKSALGSQIEKLKHA